MFHLFRYLWWMGRWVIPQDLSQTIVKFIMLDPKHRWQDILPESNWLIIWCLKLPISLPIVNLKVQPDNAMRYQNKRQGRHFYFMDQLIDYGFHSHNSALKIIFNCDSVLLFSFTVASFRLTKMIMALLSQYYFTFIDIT